MTVSKINIRQIGAATGLLSPATLLVLGSLVLPMLILLRYSFNAYDPMLLMRETFTLENYVRFFAEPYFHTVILTTLAVALGATIGSIILGFPIAYFLARTQSRFKSFLVVLVIFPLLVGNVVRAAGWITLFGTRGVVNVTLMNLGIISQPIEIMYTDFAVVIGTLSVVLPFMILTLQGVIENVDFSIVDAALNLGASRYKAFTRIFLPMIMPGVLAGFVLIFILCMNAYATPYLLGGPGYKMMAPTLYNQISSVANWPFASALAFILMAVTVISTLLVTRLTTRRRR
ncbi:ABC transporter permease [Pseudodonghicola xiamenensis]|uniref:ABC transporter permease n=1 Tax=Pseudodonghicola xiamenensis TaxID=337702 RepID=A0A8J3HCF9_9RHOB|nr:ABC transporter permease [Pseudodonghicola xiamenensis]GHH02966.1 ABC transporter permease [Pseudodonghicola xiamenensis]